MVLLRYLLLLMGIGLLVGAAGILVWDLYQILKSRRARVEPSIRLGETLTPEPVIRWHAARRLAILAVAPLLGGLSIAIVPSGAAGIRVNQFAGTRPTTLYPGLHLVLPL